MKQLRHLATKVTALVLIMLMFLSMVPAGVAGTVKAEAASSNQDIIWDYLINDLGFNTAAACAALANIKNESGFDPHNSYKEKNGTTSYGICQWNSGGRLKNLKSWCEKKNYDYTTLKAQLAFMKHELTEVNWYKTRVYNNLKKADNTVDGAKTAAYVWAAVYEVCSKQYYDERKVQAGVYWKTYAGNGIVSTGISVPVGNPNNPTVLFQTDYDNVQYGYGEDHTLGTVSDAGCGLLSLTNAVYYLTGNRIKVTTLAQYALENNYRSTVPAKSWAGTKPAFFASFLKNHGDEYSVALESSIGSNYGGTLSSDSFKTLADNLAKGQVAICHIKNHYMAIVAYNASDKSFLILDSCPSNNRGTRNKGEKGYAWKTEKQLQNMGLDMLRFLKYTGKTMKYTVTAKDVTASKTTNYGAEFNVGINPKASVKKIHVFWSTEKSLVSAVNNKTAFSTEGKLNHRLLWANSKGETKSSYKFDTNNGNKTQNDHTITFKPGTKQFYKFIVEFTNGTKVVSDMNSFTTKNDKPGAVKNLSFSNSVDDIYAKGSKITVSWKKSDLAHSYKVYLYDSNGSQLWKKENLTALSATTDAINNIGSYTVKVIAHNNDTGDSAEASKKLTVMGDIKITFDMANGGDFDNNQSTIQEIPAVKYGGEFTTLKAPTRTGYTFTGWKTGNKTVAANTKVTNVKSNITYTAQWRTNEYNVKFIGFNDKLIDTIRVPFGTQLTADDYPNAPEVSNFTFLGWSEESYKVGAGEHTISARYKWAHPTNIFTEVVSINRAKSPTASVSSEEGDGYNVNVRLTVNPDAGNAIKGRVVVALKTSTGRLLIETESAAFVFYPNSTQATSKSIDVFVPYEFQNGGFAAVADVYVVNNYSSAGIISNVVHDTTKITAANTDKWLFSTTKPVLGSNGVTAVDEDQDYVSYDILTTETKDSLATSLAGYQLVSSNWVKTGESGSNPIYYVEKWPRIGNSAGVKSQGTKGSQFNNNTAVGKYLYNKYNGTPKKAGETTTSKTVVNNVSDGAIYWHWCMNRDNGELEHMVSDDKWYADTTTGNKYYTFHAWWVSANDDVDWQKTWAYSSFLEANAYVRKLTGASAQHRDQCKDSKFWKKRLPVYKQTWTQYTKKFTYTKSSTTDTNLKAKTAPTFNPQTSSVTSNGVPLTTKIEKKAVNVKQWYAYKSSESVVYDQTEKNKYDIVVNDLGNDYKGKTVSVYVYKGLQMSDYNTEYIGTGNVDENGNLSILGAQMREACSAETGDFTIAVALENETNAVIAGTIEAPKPTYTVTFQADISEIDAPEITVEEGAEEGDGQDVVATTDDMVVSDMQIVDTQTDIKEGESAQLPDETLIPVKEGYHFKGWNQSVVNIRSDLTVQAEYEKNEYAVVFVDWENQKVNIEKYEYGDQINTPELPEVEEGMEVRWVVFDQDESTVDQTLEEFTANGGVVTEDMVIAAEYTVKQVELTVVHLEDQAEARRAVDTVDVQNIDQYRTSVDLLEYEDLIQLDEYENDYPDDIEFLGWRTADGNDLESIEITDDMLIYPVYSFDSTVSMPEADVITGEYNEAQTVTLTCDTAGATILYTTDGSDPSISSTAIQYTSPIVLEKSTELSFYAVALGMNDSAVNTEYYAINTETSGRIYHLVTVYSNISEDAYFYQKLIRDGVKLNDDGFKNVTGYTYLGLFYDEEGKIKFETEIETVTEKLDLYALYEPLMYEVRFLDEDGVTQIGDTQNVSYGQAAIPPQVPEKENYVFIGWTPDSYEYISDDTIFTATYIPIDEYATVSLDKKKLSVLEGTSYKLVATVSPEDLSDAELSWTSSNTDVAVVDETGLLSLVGTGEATIKVTVVSTNENDECKVTVSKNPETSLVLNRNSKLDVDSQGYLRRVKEGSNTVAKIRNEFNADGLLFRDMNGNVLGEEDLVGTGTEIILTGDDENEMLDEMIVVMTGDYDGDGKIQNEDVTLMAQFVESKRSGFEFQDLACDVNGDGLVNERDGLILTQYLVGKANII